VLDLYGAPAGQTASDTDIFGALDQDTVLVAYDGSRHAKAAIVETAHRLGSNRCLIVLTVWQPVWALPLAGALSPEETATRIAYQGASLARSIGFDARPITASANSVSRAIVDCAEAHDASVVVLGSRGGAGASLAVRGIAAGVARHTTRSVLISAPASAECPASTLLIVHKASAEGAP
jgi:nucleotide-binding universal stress UspA family protein